MVNVISDGVVDIGDLFFVVGKLLNFGLYFFYFEIKEFLRSVMIKGNIFVVKKFICFGY